ncbi:MAG: Ig-like domain-containing protein [Ruminococcus sp.]|nr:Ig-like domain-containing protein [Ruminococcus sp.]MDD5890276.1 Ig-like domain-containing protein [Ruminococcus sp.]
MKVKKITAVLVVFLVAVTSVVLPLSDTFNSVIKTTESAKAVTKNSTVKMPTDAIKFSSKYDKFEVLCCPEKNGFYYFNNYNDYAIKFYDVKNNTVRKVVDYNKKGFVDAFATKSKMYVITEKNVYSSSAEFYLEVFNPITEKVELTQDLSKCISVDNHMRFVTLGVDNEGRYYLVTYNYSKKDKKYSIVLLSKDFKELSSVDIDDEVYDFCGFDSTNGNFYYEGYTNWVYWGYDHDMNALKCGNVSNNKISLCDKYLDLLYQVGYTPHYNNASMLTDGSLAWTSSVYSKVAVMDSKNYNFSKDTTVTETLSVTRAGYEEKNKYYDSTGTRVVHNNKNNTTVMYINDNEIAEFDSDSNKISSYKTQHPVFAMFNYGDNIIAIEKDGDGNYYINNINWSQPTKITLSSYSEDLEVGKSVIINAKSNAEPTYSYTWSSSNNSVASVTGDGTVYGNGEGSAVITIECENGVKARCYITVEYSEQSEGKKNPIEGKITSNVSKNDYYNWSSVMNSYLSENEDGTLNRVENTDNGVLVEKYSADGTKLISTNTIEKELSKFGGYFLGKDNNYLVFGEENKKENDSQEVVRVVKYTKDWTRVSDCKIYGSNTYIPFEAGSLRMIELDGKLYVYTCHEMYADENGTNHQANMLFTIDESTMKTTDSMYNVSNLMNGYVSHSFNQFIRTDGDYIYRVDHSESDDYYMNDQLLTTSGITLTKYNKSDSSTNVSVTVPQKFELHSGNYTGASIGGFELGSNNCLVAYNEAISETNENRNIYLTVTDTLLNKTKKISLTNYSDNDNVNCSTPQLVKVNENLFLVMWEESINSDDYYYDDYDEDFEKEVNTKVMTVDSNGNTISPVKTLSVRLSDCQPILCSDKLVKWYVSDGKEADLCIINPYDIGNFHNHKWNDGVDVNKATCTSEGLKKYTCTECGETCTKITPKAKHSYKVVTKGRYCTEDKVKTYTCKVCGYTKKETIKATSHQCMESILFATPLLNGRVTKECWRCGKVISDKILYKASNIKIANATYNGKTQKPKATVKTSKNTLLKNNEDYVVVYPKNSKNVGRYKAKVDFIGYYMNYADVEYNITPKSTSIKSLKSLSKGIQVNLKLQKTQTTGYQIQYSTSSKFKNAKTVTVKNNVSTKKITKLLGKKKYFVRVRTYKTTKYSGMKYNIYSSWSSAKTVTTKR